MELRFHLQLINHKKKKKSSKIKKIYQGNIILTLFFVLFETARFIWDEIKNEPIYEFPKIPKHLEKKLNKEVRLEKKHYKAAFLTFSIIAMSLYLSDNPYILALEGGNINEEKSSSFLYIQSAQAEDSNVPENMLPDSKALGSLVSGDKLCVRDKTQKRSSNYCGTDQTEAGIDQIQIEPRSETKKFPIKRVSNYTRGIRCAHPGDKPRKSKQGKGTHMDEDCCPDPDEYPMPGCAYSANDLAIMKKR
jgi:hypothetical protein